MCTSTLMPLDMPSSALEIDALDLRAGMAAGVCC